jgi:murein DD-endopeptidase MepM/ murein hydrolase activator NlpD
MADGVVARSEPGDVLLDLDGDGHEETGWVILYLHISSIDRIPAGKQVKTGDPIGHPSCEGGEATGTHTHVARKYNGEWILADGPIPFNLEGWVAHNGSEPYLGTFTRFSQTVTASDVSEIQSVIKSGGK